MRIAVIDGRGGGIGRALVKGIRASNIEAHLLALGTNSVAMSAMLKAGADEGASGERAILQALGEADVVLGVIGIIKTGAMQGEITPKIAAAIGACAAQKILIPMNRCGIHVVSVPDTTLGEHIENAIKEIATLG